eukprot:5547285-Lingulodinium_polyedra.AAC.1
MQSEATSGSDGPGRRASPARASGPWAGRAPPVVTGKLPNQREQSRWPQPWQAPRVWSLERVAVVRASAKSGL